MKNKILFIKIIFYIGIAADFLSIFPLVFPGIAKIMFGLTNYNTSNEYLYVSRIGASLMAGWTLLLLWGSFKPIERRGILFLTLFPVLSGLLISSILTVISESIEFKYMLPLWIFYTVIIPLYFTAYFVACNINSEKN